MQRLLIVLVLFSFIALTSEATILKKFTLEELRNHASSVVVGRVSDLRYQNVNGRVWTIVTLEVEYSLKGNTTGKVHFRLPGGAQSVDGRTLVTRVDEVPEIRLSEKGIFFLETKPPAIAGLLGWNQGFYRVFRKGNQQYVVRSDGRQSPQNMEAFLSEFRKGVIGQ